MMSHRNVQPHVSINEVACNQTEKTLMGCADPLSKGVGAPHQCSRVHEKRSGWGGVVTSLAKKVAEHPRLNHHSFCWHGPAAQVVCFVPVVYFGAIHFVIREDKVLIVGGALLVNVPRNPIHFAVCVWNHIVVLCIVCRHNQNCQKIKGRRSMMGK